MAFVIFIILDYVVYYLGILVLIHHKISGRTIFDCFFNKELLKNVLKVSKETAQ